MSTRTFLCVGADPTAKLDHSFFGHSIIFYIIAFARGIGGILDKQVLNVT